MVEKKQLEKEWVHSVFAVFPGLKEEHGVQAPLALSVFGKAVEEMQLDKHKHTLECINLAAQQKQRPSLHTSCFLHVEQHAG